MGNTAVLLKIPKIELEYGYEYKCVANEMRKTVDAGNRLKKSVKVIKKR
jgi:hypothetical protein